MSRINIINPAAGKGIEDIAIGENAKNISTAGIGDAERLAREICDQTPNAEITVYGGDGTINEAVNGIINSLHADTATLSAYPSGTGNDFLRYSKNETIMSDVAKYNDRYFINILNIGFDCDVVIKTDSMKKIPFLSGSMAYILSVAARLFKKFGQKMKIEAEDENGEFFTYEGDLLLCLVANGAYYGGGFNASPESKIDDGVLELIMVKKLSRLKFISLVGIYKKGLHIEDGKIIDKFKDVIMYKRCKNVKISGIKYFCADGEIEYLNAPQDSVNINVVPSAIRFKF